MKKILNTKIKDMKAITLIALVITIVILLILAAVLINITLGNNGLFSKAKLGSEQYKEAQVKEKVEVLLAEYTTEKYTTGKTLTEFLEVKKTKGAIDEYTDNGDETITVEIDGYECIINVNNLKVIDIGKSGTAKITVIEIGKNNIKVKMQNVEAKNYEFLISTDGVNYTSKQTSTTNNIYDFTELNESTEHHIKINVTKNDDSVDVFTKSVTTNTPVQQ